MNTEYSYIVMTVKGQKRSQTVVPIGSEFTTVSLSLMTA